MSGNLKIENEIRRLIENEEPYALELIYDYLGKRLYGYILTLVCSEHDAEELVQDLFLKIVDKKRKLLRSENLAAYIFAMGRNLAMEHLRREKRDRDNLEQYEGYLCIKDDSSDRISKTDSDELHKALSSLPIEQKEVITMKIFQGMTFEEISGLLNVSMNTLGSRYRYGIEKLRSQLKRDYHRNGTVIRRGGFMKETTPRRPRSCGTYEGQAENSEEKDTTME